MNKLKVLFFMVVTIFSGNLVQATGLNNDILKKPIKLLSGETINIKDLLKEKPVYLKFWATWCKPCMQEMPHLQHTQEKYGDKFHVVAVNIDMNDDLEAVKAVQKKFKLSMPVAMDSSSELAQSFDLIGTPYHLIITQEGKLVHKGHEASAELDNKIGLLAEKPSSNLTSVAITPADANQLLVEIEKRDRAILFFTATWCDWYLEDSRPEMSKQCTQAQKAINNIYKLYPKYNWMGVASRLWTGEKDLKDYLKKHSVTHDFTIDTSNESFFKYKVKNIPALLIVDNGKVSYRTSDFSNLAELKAILSSTKSTQLN